jgi:1,4-alpha-glucan branching enzyme
LRAYSDHLEYRWKAYLQARAEIVATAGSLPEFARGGYQRYGIVRDAAAGRTVYREWAPAAQAAALIGDFSNWEPVWMARGEFGVWSVELPDGARGRFLVLVLVVCFSGLFAVFCVVLCVASA